MSDKISRRDFLKISGLGITAATVLTGCGPASRYVTRQQYVDMPEYNQTGVSTYYATTCRECPAGCGLVVRTQEGRAIKVEGNPNHPVNQGKVCSRGLTSVQGLYNPDRIGGPQKRTRGTGELTPVTWGDAIQVITTAFNDPSKIAFLFGLQPDHLYDLAMEISQVSGAAIPLRYNTLGTLEGRSTLLQASKEMFGTAQLPYFDMANADVVFSFGANFFETWLSPLAYSRGYRNLRKQNYGKRGFLVSFEARQSLTSGKADLWVPVTPGSEGMVAMAIGKIAAQVQNKTVPEMFANVDIATVSKASGVSENKLKELGEIFGNAEHPLALPGGSALTTSNGVDAGKAILGLNVLAENLGKPGGLFIVSGDAPVSNLEEVKSLIQRMNNGEVNTLLIHGVNPIFELPPALGFKAALGKVKTVISFSSFEDETVLESDYVMPDHTGLEAFGYQRVLAGADRATLSSLQPVVQPIHDTRATADILLAAIANLGGDLAAAVNYIDEVDFIQQKITYLIQSGGFYTASELPTFWSKWLQYGGWWKSEAGLRIPSNAGGLENSLTFNPPQAVKEDQTFHLVTFGTQMGDGSGANRPWLQETPDPMTTVTWNSWIEIHPETADKLGIHDDDVVEVKSVDGSSSLEAIVYRFPAIRPDTVAIPFGQGHTALGRYAEGRGCNPAQVWVTTTNLAGEAAISDTQVTITPTGKRRPLARQESKAGVYGDH
ncbi:MAG: hypothetical protein CVU39_05190 [Chloroflexi bacterium HGW-Chloroflexi-10]|nr:MAG: hypothetical protein CVU39_05190 [Chloroflexi bacterium HGW-Chloroflexi-10]